MCGRLPHVASSTQQDRASTPAWWQAAEERGLHLRLSSFPRTAEPLCTEGRSGDVVSCSHLFQVHALLRTHNASFFGLIASQDRIIKLDEAVCIALYSVVFSSCGNALLYFPWKQCYTFDFCHEKAEGPSPCGPGYYMPYMLIAGSHRDHWPDPSHPPGLFSDTSCPYLLIALLSTCASLSLFLLNGGDHS